MLKTKEWGGSHASMLEIGREEQKELTQRFKSDGQGW
jgi:hypothetical protein